MFFLSNKNGGRASPSAVAFSSSTETFSASLLQRRAPYQARKGRCSTLNCCMSSSLNRGRFKETCSRSSRETRAISCRRRRRGSTFR
ncbi:hypothetical protein CO661_05350 [Sinorhizobium fredii]|uniref:Uncharacterized protein n=1 Tax=Rhizobium fredii TaxID=380 RepID=A0A2A6M4B1_RHIFR|nr:hypothetical protein CO661_05350 [Sinorhizobium fredii]